MSTSMNPFFGLVLFIPQRVHVILLKPYYYHHLMTMRIMLLLIRSIFLPCLLCLPMICVCSNTGTNPALGACPAPDAVLGAATSPSLQQPVPAPVVAPGPNTSPSLQLPGCSNLAPPSCAPSAGATCADIAFHRWCRTRQRTAVGYRRGFWLVRRSRVPHGQRPARPCFNVGSYVPPAPVPPALHHGVQDLWMGFRS
jgi:hypothetical protein